jgi:hypothetical protein
VPCASHFACFSLPASRVKTSTNSRPMILRLASGSATPASWPRKLLAGVDRDHLDVQPVGEHLHHEAAFVEAQQPVVDEDAGQPVADRLWISAAATLESTPPERPRMTSSSPTWLADARHRLVDVVAHHPVGLGAADLEDEALEQLAPLTVCVTSGWNCTA